MPDLTLTDLAEQVLDSDPAGSKHAWGEETLRLVELHQNAMVDAEVRVLIVTALGRRVAGIKGQRERVAMNNRLVDRGVSYTGRPITPTLSIRDTNGARQYVLWTEASPQQFIEAVLREQVTIDGRNDSNAVRLQVVEMVQADKHLMGLPTLRAVCDELGVDPDTLGLEDLG